MARTELALRSDWVARAAPAARTARAAAGLLDRPAVPARVAALAFAPPVLVELAFAAPLLAPAAFALRDDRPVAALLSALRVVAAPVRGALPAAFWPALAAVTVLAEPDLPTLAALVLLALLAAAWAVPVTVRPADRAARLGRDGARRLAAVRGPAVRAEVGRDEAAFDEPGRADRVARDRFWLAAGLARRAAGARELRPRASMVACSGIR